MISEADRVMYTVKLSNKDSLATAVWPARRSRRHHQAG
jgi:hypothetical protein